jgi:nucleoside-diphosphate-sugar epimerase
VIGESVLVTGGSGFIAGHCILELLEAGYSVRASIRATGTSASVRANLARAGAVNIDNLSFVEADLNEDAGWVDAAAGVDYVLHVASPIHTGKVQDEQQVIAPAREGSLRVLRAACQADVKRVVLTSAFHAIGFGHGHVAHTFTEDDWSVLDGPGVDAYGRSKTIAERAAWDFMAKRGGSTELTTLLPVAVMGPVISSQISGANQIVERMLNGDMPGFPNVYVPIIDVRDVAQAHVTALKAPDAAGHRFLLSNSESPTAMRRIGEILVQHLGEDARRVPRRTLPDVVVRLAARFNPEFAPVAAELNYVKRISNARARRVLGLNTRPTVQTVTDAADSLIARSLLKPI